MIREFSFEDLNQINLLLKNLNYEITQKELENEFLKVLVFEESKVIKGILVYSLIYERIEIDYIIVDENYRRQQIATKLLKYLEDLNKNIINITLEVKKSNEPAICFYKKNGFSEVSIRKNYYNDEDGILMIKKIGD